MELAKTKEEAQRLRAALAAMEGELKAGRECSAALERELAEVKEEAERLRSALAAMEGELKAAYGAPTVQTMFDTSESVSP
jgi:septal ring factor EnvC (AmiA/AmiB activator)